MSAIDNLEAQVETVLARADESADCCYSCGLQISSERQRKVPGAAFFDVCAGVDLEGVKKQ